MRFTKRERRFRDKYKGKHIVLSCLEPAGVRHEISGVLCGRMGTQLFVDDGSGLYKSVTLGHKAGSCVPIYVGDRPPEKPEKAPPPKMVEAVIPSVHNAKSESFLDDEDIERVLASEDSYLADAALLDLFNRDFLSMEIARFKETGKCFSFGMIED